MDIRSAIVTGAASGIGKEAVRRLRARHVDLPEQFLRPELAGAESGLGVLRK